jgi:hypothetical protein
MNGLTGCYCRATLWRMGRDTDATAPVEHLCRSPWLIVYGQGPSSEEAARTVAAQCKQAGIQSRMRAIDECYTVELNRFPGLVAVLPTWAPSMKIRQALEPFANLIADYRARWNEGLAGVLTGQVDPFDAAPVSLLGQRVLVHNSAMRSAFRRACAIHYLDDGKPIEVLRPYQEASGRLPDHEAPWERDDDVASEVLSQTWAYLKSWSITDPACVPQLLQQIQQCRSYFENPAKPTLYRPLPEYQRNRLDIILDGPDGPYGNTKTWHENGARVWRYVYEQLRLVDLAIARPGSANRGDAQKDLRRLYLSLRIIEAWLRDSGDSGSELSG